jgi:hypothetical protein
MHFQMCCVDKEHELAHAQGALISKNMCCRDLRAEPLACWQSSGDGSAPVARMLGSLLLLLLLLLLLSAASVMISFTLALYTTCPPRSVMPAAEETVDVACEAYPI